MKMRMPDQESILELDKLDPNMQLPEIGEMNEDGFDAYSPLEPPFQIAGFAWLRLLPGD